MKPKSNSFLRAVGQSFSRVVCAGAVLLIASSVQAEIYNVDRAFTQGVLAATLIGTVDIPLGNYTIQNSSASPFSSVNLTLTVGGTPYTLDSVLTGIIIGT